MRMRGGRGSKIQTILRTSFKYPPYTTTDYFIWTAEYSHSHSSNCVTDSRQAALRFASPRARCNVPASTTLQGRFAMSAQRDSSIFLNALVRKDEIYGISIDSIFIQLIITLSSACECNTGIGALDDICDRASGQCQCKANYGGRQCYECGDGYWYYPDCEG